MNRVSEIYRSGITREANHLALGRERINLFRIKVDLQRAQKIRGIFHILLPFDEMAQPRDSLIFAVVRDKLSVFIFPMCCDTFFGDAMHFCGSNLYFEWLAARDHRSVQRLVHVRPGHCNEVFNSPGDRPPRVVDDTKRSVAVLHAVGDDSQREQVVDLVDRDPLLLQLQKDRVEPLGARLGGARYAVLFHLVFDELRHLCEKGFVLSPVPLDDVF